MPDPRENRNVYAFGRLAPDQKSRLVKALQQGGEAVGFLGDGINDAPALKAADIGLSVDSATGVAQAAADMILLAPDLEVVADGVEEGRRTFANILKYVRFGIEHYYAVNQEMVDKDRLLQTPYTDVLWAMLENVLRNIADLPCWVLQRL